MNQVSGNSLVPYFSRTTLLSASINTSNGGSPPPSTLFSVSRASAALSSVVTVSRATLGCAFSALARSLIDGISSRQGRQVLVQKLSSTTLPRKLDNRTLLPSIDGSSKSGASRLRAA